MSEFRIERDDASAPFFDAAREGQLVIRRCAVCGRLYPPAQERCADSDELEWVPVAGTGTLVTWAVDHGSVSPELTALGDGGEIIAVVELDEGPWLNTAVPGVDVESLREGLPMRVQFLPLGGGEPVAVFVPA